MTISEIEKLHKAGTNLYYGKLLITDILIKKNKERSRITIKTIGKKSTFFTPSLYAVKTTQYKDKFPYTECTSSYCSADNGPTYKEHSEDGAVTLCCGLCDGIVVTINNEKEQTKYRNYRDSPYL